MTTWWLARTPAQRDRWACDVSGFAWRSGVNARAPSTLGPAHDGKPGHGFDHYSLLRTAEDLLGLSAIGDAVSAIGMQQAFNLETQ